MADTFEIHKPTDQEEAEALKQSSLPARRPLKHHEVARRSRMFMSRWNTNISITTSTISTSTLRGIVVANLMPIGIDTRGYFSAFWARSSAILALIPSFSLNR